jgi:hypothetical protein
MKSNRLGGLGEQTAALAGEISTLIESVFPRAPEFEVEVFEQRSVIRPVGEVVPLFVDRARLATLNVSVSCCLDIRRTVSRCRGVALQVVG